MTATSVYPANDMLGEGPVWNPAEQAIYWVDIERCRLQRFQTETKTHDHWDLPARIGSYALREQGGAILALENGFHFFDFATSNLSLIHDPEPTLGDNRFNDGKCDRQGRFWAGTMGNGEPTAALYRLDSDLSCHTIRTGVNISNGLGWSPDNKTMYYTDTALGHILAFDYDPTTGTPSKERVFAKINNGAPDGLTVDSEGAVWTAVWDGWRVERFGADGSHLLSLELPVQRPTSCMFGGKDLKELFITSASVGLTDEERTKQPEAGHLFSVETTTTGILEPRFNG